MNAIQEWNLIEQMMVCDFNPNHDPKDGRFTSGSGLTKQSLSVTSGYTSSESSIIINELLRYDEPLGGYQETVDRLDASMEVVQRPMEIYRGVSFSFLDNALEIPKTVTFEELSKMLQMRSFTDKGFVSCSTSYNEAKRHGPVLLKIKVRPGAMALKTSNDEEKEIILGRNQNYFINSVEKDGSRIILNVEV